MNNPDPLPPATPAAPTQVFAFAALAVSLIGVAGTLFLSLSMHLEACPLCLYQRMAVMGVASVLLVGLVSGANRKVAVCRLALPLTVAGLIVAAFHCYLDYKQVLECPAGVFGLGKPPYQSLAMFVLLLVALLADESVQWMRDPAGISNVTGALIIGGAIGIGCIQSGPPLKKPNEPYKTELKGCRPMYHPVQPNPKQE